MASKQKPVERLGPRHRGVVISCAAMVLWAVAGYGWGASEGLLGLSLAVAGIAIAIPRPLPSTARAAVWTAVGMIAACLAANQARISPLPEMAAALETSPYDRVVTVGIGLALSALLFRPSRATVTVAASGAMPALMIALLRDTTHIGSGREFWLIWGFLGLMALAEQGRRTMTRSYGHTAWRRGLQALWVPLLVLIAASLLAGPLGGGARQLRERIFGMLTSANPLMIRSRRGAELSVMPPGLAWAGQTRLIATIHAPVPPGYLREAVYRQYREGRWLPPSAGSPLEADPDAKRLAGDNRVFQMRLRPSPITEDGLPGRVPFDSDDGAPDAWQVRLLHPRRMAGLLLPGQAVALELGADNSLRRNRDGTVSSDGLPPSVYRVREEGALQAFSLQAYPMPAPPDDPAYLAVPDALAGAVSNWVSASGMLTGLAGDGPSAPVGPEKRSMDVGADPPDGALAVMQALVRYFQTTFHYSLDPLPTGRGDPLERFMEARRGHCTLFASAAVFMLRAAGIPARIVAGYYTSERHPLTDAWVARERDGHAWVEAWDVTAGIWRLLEPTPPEGIPGGDPPVSGVRLAWEWLMAQWQAFRDLLQQANPLGLAVEGAVAAWFAVEPIARLPRFWLALLAGLVVWRGWRRLRQRPDAEVRLRRRLIRTMQRLERRWSPAGMGRKPRESWEQWRRRIADGLTPDQAARLDRIVETYQSLRYAPDAPRTRMEAWIRSAPGNGKRSRNACG